MATRPNQYNTDTELSSVNSILAAIGSAPVTELDFANPEISLVYNLLQECCADVQAEGWVFNREERYPIQPNENNFILIPDNVARIDISEGQVYRDCDVVMRGGQLYNKFDHTYEFKDTLYCDITWLFDYEDLPSSLPSLHHLQSSRTCSSTADDG